MTALAEAVRAVRTARIRLAAHAALGGASRGMLAATAAAGVAGGLLHLVGLPAAGAFSPWLLVLPLLGLAAGAAGGLRAAPGVEASALTLDRAAGTGEAFVSAVAAPDAVPAFRELSAVQALGVCRGRRLRDLLPLRAPGSAAAAALAVTLLAALVLLNREPGPSLVEIPLEPAPAAPGAGAGAAPASTGPSERALSLRESVLGGAAREDLLPAVRRDLAALTGEELRAVAEALAARGDEDARAALDALARGDREGATARLRRALGAASPGGGAAGGETALPGADADAVRPWAGASWPLRYDPVVRRYLEERR